MKVGASATAFVTVANAGPNTATGVGILLATLVPAAFNYQTTDPATNQLTGTINTPVDIPAGGARTFAIALTPAIAFAPIEVAFTFTGANAPPAPVLVGVNTLLLSAANDPVPDVIALAATIGNTGIVDVPGDTGNAAFGVATANIGASGTITVTADTGGAVLPLTIGMCPASLTTGQCTSAPTEQITRVFDAFGVPAFALFVTGSGTIPFDAAKNRIFVRFRDAQGITRGSTSVAVRTAVSPP